MSAAIVSRAYKHRAPRTYPALLLQIYIWADSKKGRSKLGDGVWFWPTTYARCFSRKMSYKPQHKPRLFCQDNPDGTDEGSAMVELAYDIAPNAEYKFHTTSFGEQVSWIKSSTTRV